jgi:imidazolonepropionase-like amidohydrolase
MQKRYQIREFHARRKNMKLINAHLIDGTGADPLEGATLIFEEQVQEISVDGGLEDHPGEEILDVGGRTVIPGLINAHTHICMDSNAPDTLKAISAEPPGVTAIRAAQRVGRMLEAGITTARDLGGAFYIDLEVRDLVKSGEIPGPRLLCAGKLITMTGGHGWIIGQECDGADEVRKGVREQLKAGADVIKLMATGGVMTPGVQPGSAQLTEEELRAGIEEAGKANRRTATHAQGLEGIKNAIRAGINTIEHGFYLDEEAVAMMVERGIVFVPTLAAAYQLIQAGTEAGIPQYVIDKISMVDEAHKRSFQLAWKAGVVLAAGNDGGTPFNPQEDLATEIQLMVQLGLPVVDAIRAGTWGSALALGLEEEIGTLEVGKQADLVVLDGDPMADIEALRRVWCVVQGGRVVYREDS